jgi:hypothetical protein
MQSLIPLHALVFWPLHAISIQQHIQLLSPLPPRLPLLRKEGALWRGPILHT